MPPPGGAALFPACPGRFGNFFLRPRESLRAARTLFHLKSASEKHSLTRLFFVQAKLAKTLVAGHSPTVMIVLTSENQITLKFSLFLCLLRHPPAAFPLFDVVRPLDIAIRGVGEISRF